MGDGAEVLDQLVAGHADARVGDGQGAGVLVRPDLDADRRVGLVDGRSATRLEESELLAGIGRVGDEFADEDLAVGVKGMDDDIENLLDLGLERMGFGLAHVLSLARVNSGSGEAYEAAGKQHF